MSADNVCNFVGRCTQEPELKYTSDGQGVLYFALAVNSGYSKGKQEDIVVFPRFKLFGKRAESLVKHIVKGQVLSIQAIYCLDVNENKYYPWFLVQDLRLWTKPKKELKEETVRLAPSGQ